MITGLRPETYEKLQLDAGIFLIGYTLPETVVDAATMKQEIAKEINAGTHLLGATRGGGTFRCVPTMRGIEADGKRSEFVGSMVNDGWDVRLTTTLIEMTGENFKRAFPSAEMTGDAAKTVIKPKTAITKDDYKSLMWIGETSMGAMLINLTNAMNVAGAQFTFTDKGEGELPVEFRAFQSTVLNQDYAPCEIHFLGANTASTASNTK
ncbi:MAG: hypothetical protein IJ354_10585 [Clostridia bacterium]|nr:hypothetical protein [Clostridia bacterium]